MSRLVPDRVIDAVKNFNDIAVDIAGIDCTLYIPSNLANVDMNTAYVPTLTFTEYLEQKVWIEWKPTIKRLRKLGWFSEDELPIIAWFKHDPMVVIKSYIKVPYKYVLDTRVAPSTTDTTITELEVIELLGGVAHDAELTRCVKLASRRV